MLEWLERRAEVTSVASKQGKYDERWRTIRAAIKAGWAATMRLAFLLAVPKLIGAVSFIVLWRILVALSLV